MKRRSAGFTLIELLVVIAIIAILAAILFPVFLAAKRRSQLAACVSNIKQVGLATILYATDHNDQMPRYSVDGGDNGGFAQYYYAMNGSHGGCAPYTVQLKNYVKTPKLFRCPIDTGIDQPDDSRNLNGYWDVFRGRPVWAQTGFAAENFTTFAPNGDGATSKTPPGRVRPYCTDHNAPGFSYAYNARCSDRSMSRLPAEIRGGDASHLPDSTVNTAADVKVYNCIWYWHLGVKEKVGSYKPTCWLDGHVTTPPGGPRPEGSEVYTN